MSDDQSRQERREDIQSAMLDCLKNGGGDVIRKIFKESLNDIGLHIDDAKNLREDFGFLRYFRIRTNKNKDVIWQTAVRWGIYIILGAVAIGLGLDKLLGGG